MLKGQKHSEETRKRMSYSQSGENHPFYGKKHSEETKAKIRLARAKQINTQAMNDSRSEKLKGRKFSKESIEKMRQHALKRFSDKKNHPHYGKKFSEEHKNNMSKALKGITLDERFDLERAESIRKQIRQARAKQIFPLEDTSIEVKVQDFLKQLGIEYFTHQHMPIEHSYRCDIFIPSFNLVIECDGQYWHQYPTGTHIDKIRTTELINKGFKVLRLWEFEINDMTVENFKLQLDKNAN